MSEKTTEFKIKYQFKSQLPNTQQLKSQPMALQVNVWVGDNLNKAPKEQLIIMWWNQYNIYRNTFDWNRHFLRFIPNFLTGLAWEELILLKVLTQYRECGGDDNIVRGILECCHPKYCEKRDAFLKFKETLEKEKESEKIE